MSQEITNMKPQLFEFNNFDSKNFLIYLILNLSLILTILLVTKVFSVAPIYLSIVSILIITLQYRYILRHKTFIKKLIIYYLSFVIFCYCVNFIDVIENMYQFSDLEAYAGLFVRGFAFVLFGHIYGLVFLPFVIGINWLFRNKTV